MPIDRNTLDETARAYVSTMTSIRGRRVHRLLMREFAAFDVVVRAVAEDDASALLAIAEDGSGAVCRTDGTGREVSVVRWARLEGAVVVTAYDLLKDSLPVVSWSIWHPSVAQVAGALRIGSADLAPGEITRLSEILRAVGR